MSKGVWYQKRSFIGTHAIPTVTLPSSHNDPLTGHPLVSASVAQSCSTFSCQSLSGLSAGGIEGANFAGLIGAGIGIGVVFGALILGVARNPSLRALLFSYAILGFAFSEATGLSK